MVTNKNLGKGNERCGIHNGAGQKCSDGISSKQGDQSCNRDAERKNGQLYKGNKRTGA